MHIITIHLLRVKKKQYNDSIGHAPYVFQVPHPVYNCQETLLLHFLSHYLFPGPDLIGLENYMWQDKAAIRSVCT